MESRAKNHQKRTGIVSQHPGYDKKKCANKDELVHGFDFTTAAMVATKLQVK
jgi:hypothetical protein